MATPVGNEIVLVTGVTPAGNLAATQFPVTLDQIAALAAVSSGNTPTNVTAATGTTLTAAAIISGLINRSGTSANFSDTTDTAAAIYAASGSNTANTFYTAIKNATPFVQTLLGGTGVTLSSSALVPPNSVATFLVTFTNATTAVFNHVDTTPLTTNALEITTALTTVGAGTITAAGIAGGIVQRSGAQSATAFADTTDTATNIIAGVLNAHVGQSFEFTYQNTTNAPATIGGGTGVTVSGITVAQANSSVRYLVTYTAAATVTMVGFMTTPNPQTGTVVANGASAVVVANTAVSPNSQITFTLKTIGGTPAGAPFLSAITAGTGFSVKAAAGDTSTYNYAITW